MADAPVTPRPRGFTAAISRTDARPGAGSIAIAVENDGIDDFILLSLTHADGTALTAILSDSQMGRLADILSQQHRVVGLMATTAGATIQ